MHIKEITKNIGYSKNENMKKHTFFLQVIALLMLCCVHAEAKSTDGILTTWSQKDCHVKPSDIITTSCTDTTITAWKGERVGVEALLWAANKKSGVQLKLSAWKSEGGGKVDAKNGMAQFMRYVLTDNFRSCGAHPDTLDAYLVPDVIDNVSESDLAEHFLQPVWCTFEVPRDIKAGLYTLTLDVFAGKKQLKSCQLTLNLNILDRTLPLPSEQKFHLDLWQQPYAVSRFHGVERWSQAHFDLLRPYMQMLGRAGQSVVTTILFYEPWGDQSHDKFDPMVKTVKKADGTWHYDYTIFDHYVELMDSCGVNKQINCYSMVPWDMTFRYFDEAKGDFVDLKTETGSSEYKELWTAFLQAFAAHLREKGWFEKTCIAMDERGIDKMRDAWRVTQEAVPGMKMALAGHANSELLPLLYDFCISFFDRLTPEQIAARREKGMVTTTYTCCSNDKPNIFSNNEPADAVVLPLFCIANNLDGFLHWSWINWNDDPLTDTRYRLFSPGDTFFFYPGPRSSVRYERFIEGIEAAEKVRMLREEWRDSRQTDKIEALNNLLKPLKAKPLKIGSTAELVHNVEQLLNQ